jgi:2-polyprenyl-3-methyl-5-hydroxy-6-metoxy-1,4-benzoquinol methylase
MNVRSPIYKNLAAKKVSSLNYEDIELWYKNGFGLGVDLISSLKGVKIDLYSCPQTGYQFYYPFKISGDNKFYELLDKRNIHYYSSASWEHIKSLKILEKDYKKILEIGSGNHSFLKVISDKFESVIGLELNEESVKKGISLGLDVKNMSINQYSMENENSIDAICAFQVLEHVSNVDDFISSCLRCLKKNGVLIIAVPNNNAIYFKQKTLLEYYSSQNNYRLHCTTSALNSPPHHMGIWKRQSLEKLTKKYPIRIKSINYQPLDEFRFSLSRDIVVSKLNNIVGYRLSRYIGKNFFKDSILKRIFKGDSILVEFQKIE